jgi:hypothetical protein
MRVHAAIAVLLMAMTPAPASAAQYSFKLNNFTSSDVVGVSVRGGTVTGFRRVLARSTRTFTVEVPKGGCSTRVRISFESGRIVDRSNYNVCTGSGVTVVGR